VKTALVHSETAGRFDYGREHPLRMERLPLTWRLMEAYGLTRLPSARVLSPEPAAETDIARYHTREYLDVLRRADSGEEPADGAVYGLGLGDNPVFRGLWEVAQLVAGISLLAADVVAFYWAPDGETIAVLTLAPPDNEVVSGPDTRLASTRDPAPGATTEPPQPGAGVPLTLSFIDVVTGTIRGSRAVEITSLYVNNILPYFDQYNLSHRTWSPDSSAVALPIVVNGKDQLSVIPADGSGMTPLPNAELGFWRP